MMDISSDEDCYEELEEDNVCRRLHDAISQLKQQLLTTNERSRITYDFDESFSKVVFLRKLEFLEKVLDNLDAVEQIPDDDLPPWKCRVLAEVHRRKKTILIQQRQMLTSLLIDIKRSVRCNVPSNRREIYYKNPPLFKDTSVISKAVKFFSLALEVPPWKMGVLASAKGLIQGPLTIILKNGHEIDCRSPKGTLIPQCIFNGISFVTDAHFVLILEKDTVFQKLIEEDFVSRYGPCILVTAKGFPDIGTRFFLRALFDELTLPMFIVADADPYGMDIMITYRFGSPAYERWADKLTVPGIKWLGVFPQDIRRLSIDSTELGSIDLNRVRGLQGRRYVKENSRFRDEVQFFLDNRHKCETEDLYKIAPYFLSDVYIPSNIIKKRFF